MKNLLAYFLERFPPVNMMLFTVLFFTVYSVAHFNTGRYLQIDVREILGIVAIISFFFRLRVFDEWKDYAIDTIAHPNRVLQSGRVSLKQITIMAWCGCIVEVVWSCLMGKEAVIAWIFLSIYSLLMRYEFFAGRYLKQRILLYAISHLLIMPFIIVWIWAAYSPVQNGHLILPVLMLLSFLGGLSFEIARKTHVNEAERNCVDSYSKTLGLKNSVFAIQSVLFFQGVAMICLLYMMGANLVLSIIIISLLTLIFFFYHNLLNNPVEKKLRKGELLISVFMLSGYLLIIISYCIK